MKRKQPQLSEKELEHISDLAFALTEEYIAQRKALKSSITLFPWGAVSISIDGEHFADAEENWIEHLESELKTSRKDGFESDAIPTWNKLLKKLENCCKIIRVGLLEMPKE